MTLRKKKIIFRLSLTVSFMFGSLKKRDPKVSST